MSKTEPATRREREHIVEAAWSAYVAAEENELGLQDILRTMRKAVNRWEEDARAASKHRMKCDTALQALAEEKTDEKALTVATAYRRLQVWVRQGRDD